MPKARRPQIINFHKTKKKGRSFKSGLIAKVQKFLKDFDNVVVFSYQSLTTNSLRALQNQLVDCKFCLGKKKVMKIAFGLDEDSAPFPNSHLIGEKLQGQVGLIFTNRSSDDIVDFINAYALPEFANPGVEAIADVELLAGADVFKGFSTSNEEYLKKLGLELEITDSKIHLIRPFLAAEKGRPLTVEQAKILKFLGIKLSQFKLFPVAFWSKSGNFLEY